MTTHDPIGSAAEEAAMKQSDREAELSADEKRRRAITEDIEWRTTRALMRDAIARRKASPKTKEAKDHE